MHFLAFFRILYLLIYYSFEGTMLPLLLVISLDAFMFQYFNVSKLHLPNFDYLQRRGILAPLEPQFTSKTLPNHWAMITGLYEESSNIVDNYMYDPKLGFFNFQSENASTLAEWFTFRYSGEPIWISNERRSSGPRNSGVYMWPGTLASDANSSFASKYMIHYNHSEAFDFRKAADTVVDWMSLKDVNFAMLYHPDPDDHSHRTGPFSSEVMAILHNIDDGLGYLIRKLKLTDLWPRINIILLSDHGMASIDHVIDVSLLQEDSEVFVQNCATLQIMPKPGKTDLVLSTLLTYEHVQAFRKEELPERFHYVTSERIMPIVAIADEGYCFSLTPNPYPMKGQHGFDPALPSMHGFFLGSGPKFKTREVRNKSIQPVDAHAIMKFILEVSVLPNNGSLKRVEDMLNLDYLDLLARKLDKSDSSSSGEMFTSTSIAIVVVVVVCAVVISIVFIVRILCNRRYTIVTIRGGERNGLMPLHTLRSKGPKPYRFTNENDDGSNGDGNYALLSNTSDEQT